MTNKRVIHIIRRILWKMYKKGLRPNIAANRIANVIFEDSCLKYTVEFSTFESRFEKIVFDTLFKQSFKKTLNLLVNDVAQQIDDVSCDVSEEI